MKSPIKITLIILSICFPFYVLALDASLSVGANADAEANGDAALNASINLNAESSGENGEEEIDTETNREDAETEIVASEETDPGIYFEWIDIDEHGTIIFEDPIDFEERLNDVVVYEAVYEEWDYPKESTSDTDGEGALEMPEPELSSNLSVQADLNASANASVNGPNTGSAQGSLNASANTSRTRNNNQTDAEAQLNAALENRGRRTNPNIPDMDILNMSRNNGLKPRLIKVRVWDRYGIHYEIFLDENEVVTHRREYDMYARLLGQDTYDEEYWDEKYLSDSSWNIVARNFDPPEHEDPTVETEPKPEPIEFFSDVSIDGYGYVSLAGPMFVHEVDYDVISYLPVTEYVTDPNGQEQEILKEVRAVNKYGVKMQLMIDRRGLLYRCIKYHLNPDTLRYDIISAVENYRNGMLYQIQYYDAFSRILKIEEFDLESNFRAIIRVTSYIYNDTYGGYTVQIRDAQGSLLEEEAFNSSGVRSYLHRFFVIDGLKVLEQYNTHAMLVAIKYYNAEDKVTKQEFFDRTGALTSYRLYYYNHRGRKQKIATFAPTGELFEILYYNPQERLIRRESFRDGQIARVVEY